MDSLTQAALGAVVGERVLGRQLGRRALAWGALIGTVPDLDVLANPFLDLPGELSWHRGWSHSILGLLLLTPVVGWLLWLWWRRRRTRRIAAGRTSGEATPIISLQRALVFVALNFATHVLIDCFTVYGTQLFDPFSRYRVGSNTFFIIDPLFTYPLLLWITAALFGRRPPGRAKGSWVVVCATLLLGYTAFSFGAQTLAKRRFEAELARAGIDPIRQEVSATPFNTLIWRGLFETEEAFWISYWALPDNSDPLTFHRVPKCIDLLDPHRGDRAIDCALWFSEEFCLVREAEDGFLVTDLRFFEIWPEDAADEPWTFFTWRLTPPDDADTGWTMKPAGSYEADVEDILKRLWRRWQGDRGALFPEAPDHSEDRP